jgi:hypothetical protein
MADKPKAEEPKADKPKAEPKGIVEPLTVVQRVMTIGSKIATTKIVLQSLQETAQSVAAKIPNVNAEVVAKHFSGAAIAKLDKDSKQILEMLDVVAELSQDVTKKMALFLKTPVEVQVVSAKAVTTGIPQKVE